MHLKIAFRYSKKPLISFMAKEIHENLKAVQLKKRDSDKEILKISQIFSSGIKLEKPCSVGQRNFLTNLVVNGYS